ncbi:hypothetical protein CROQUDRAFT_94063 [Cronartium quercuum f. sp. fusiforme G11]|uniref:Uncharacterized protein n=1 Tax=Cronartium quercuum f. sp. fusiforme G11 TaxID=708437 RepID=A0A9P6NKG4_9BASI|nr:hypothetical protein CROQUDRAFT_94063 [Cronartium quercuum f. sp. fusiforme G11]
MPRDQTWESLPAILLSYATRAPGLIKRRRVKGAKRPSYRNFNYVRVTTLFEVTLKRTKAGKNTSGTRRQLQWERLKKEKNQDTFREHEQTPTPESIT